MAPPPHGRMAHPGLPALLLLAAALILFASGAAAVRLPRHQADPCAGAPPSSIVASNETCQDFVYCCNGEAFPNYW